MENLLTSQVPKRTLLSVQKTCLITMESPLFPAESLPHAVTLTGIHLSYASVCFCIPVTDCMQAFCSLTMSYAKCSTFHYLLQSRTLVSGCESSIHPCMTLHPLLGLGLPQKLPPFVLIFSSSPPSYP